MNSIDDINHLTQVPCCSATRFHSNSHSLSFCFLNIYPGFPASNRHFLIARFFLFSFPSSFSSRFFILFPTLPFRYVPLFLAFEALFQDFQAFHSKLQSIQSLLMECGFSKISLSVVTAFQLVDSVKS